MRRLIRGHWLPMTEPIAYRGPATYAVRMVRRGRPVVIPRFLGCDQEGILTIGMTRQIEARRKQFVSGYSRGHGHSAANLLFPLLRRTRSKPLFKDVRFEFAFRPQKSVNSARDLESLLTAKYWKRYGEAPPLTSAFAARRDF